jgi:hypothetical protein
MRRMALRTEVYNRRPQKKRHQELQAHVRFDPFDFIDSHARRQTRRVAPCRPRVPRVSRPRQDRHRGDQADGQPARPVAGLLARRGGALRGNRQGPAERLQVHLARQPRGRDQQRHRGARPGRHRRAGFQAGDGRQGRSLQEVCRRRRVRHRDRREGPGQAGRDHRLAGAHLRRHQPGRHQGPGLLLRGARAAQAHEDPGVPRRPARHGHHGGGRHGQRPEGGRQEHRRHQAGHLGRGRRGAGLPEPAAQGGPQARERVRHRPGRRGLRRPRRADGRRQAPVHAKDRAAQARASDRRCRRVPGPVGRRRAQARDGRQHGGQAGDLRAGQPEPRDRPRRRPRGAPRRDHGHGPHRLSEPGQQRPVLPVHLPRRARLGRDHDHRRNGNRRGARDCRPGPGRAERARCRRLRR